MAREVVCDFEYDFKGIMKAKNSEIKIGGEIGETAPYDMLFGALASCLYSTFLDIAIKKRIQYDKCVIKVDGVKRSEIPMTLETVTVTAEVYNPTKEKGLDEAFRLACDYCSIFATISKVADISTELIIVD